MASNSNAPGSHRIENGDIQLWRKQELVKEALLPVEGSINSRMALLIGAEWERSSIVPVYVEYQTKN